MKILKSIIPLGITSTVVLSFGLSAAAQEPKPDQSRKPQRPTYEDVDKDGNGVTFEEFLASQEARMKKMFERMDSDKDGTLSKEEWDSRGQRVKKAPKKDGDKPAKGATAEE